MSKLGEYITEYSEKNINNEYRPVAVGKYGIRSRESIYKKELAADYSKNKVIFKNTLTVGMGSKQIDIGILSDDEIFSVSPAYRTYKISGVNSKYLGFCLQAKNKEMFESYVKQSARQGKTIDFKRWLDFEIPVPNEDTQAQIVESLESIKSLITCQEEKLTLLNELVKARFVEMFGDPIDNPMGWPTRPLTSMGRCKNGMNFHNSDSGIEINCLGVGDFKDHSVIDDTSSLPIVSLNEMPQEDYLLKDEDIVFVRSNGNKMMVGRSVVVYPGDIATTFSGFCIRYRNEDKSVSVPYLLRVLKTDSMRKQMYGRGANIQNLNQQILSALQIPVPPIELQQQYVDFVVQLDKSKFEVQKKINLYTELLNKKMDEYFNSEAN